MLQLKDITIGEVAGMIAAATALVQFLIALLLPLILVGLLKPEDTAVSWSVIARTIHASYWPTILRTDSAATNGVRKSAVVISWMITALIGLVSLAAIVTPLGLYENVSLGSQKTPTAFHYTKDASPFGLGTPSRPTLGFSRVCGNLPLVACPSSDKPPETDKVNATSNDTPSSYSTRLPHQLIDFFSSVPTRLRTVSSIFDIQWRTYTETRDKSQLKDGGSVYVVGGYRQLASLVLDDAIELVEGLVVDTRTGSIGFRNHTIPTGLNSSAVWSEDLLFIQPQTECVDTNLTLDFTVAEDWYSSWVTNLVLTDRGGFANLNLEYPNVDLNDSQANLDLYGRAYKGAWLNNAYAMFYLNISNPGGPQLSGRNEFSYLDSFIGKAFPLQVEQFNKADNGVIQSLQYNSLKITTGYGEYLNPPARNFLNGTIANYTSQYAINVPSNPWNITQNNFILIQDLCRGATNEDYANITNVGALCGLVYGTARSRDGSSSVLFEKGSNWTIPLYNCASATQALLKTVTFRHNGTDKLSDLSVVNVQDKSYPSPSEWPLWAVENTNMTLGNGSALWGLVSPEQQDVGDMSYVRKPTLWLPGFLSNPAVPMPVSISQNLPGVDFHMSAFSVAYGVNSWTQVQTPDYSGRSNLALYTKWQALTRSANSTPQIINLIWTDIAANAVVGTRGWLPSVNASEEGEVLVPIFVYGRRIKYHLVYGIPGITVLAFAAIIAVYALVLLFLGRATSSRMRDYLNRTSAGRILAAGTDGTHPELSTDEWIKRTGLTRVDLGEIGLGQKQESIASDSLLVKNDTAITIMQRRTSESSQTLVG